MLLFKTKWETLKGKAFLMPPLPLSTVLLDDNTDDIEGVGRLINWDDKECALIEPKGVAGAGGKGGLIEPESVAKGGGVDTLIEPGGVAEAGGVGAFIEPWGVAKAVGTGGVGALIEPGGVAEAGGEGVLNLFSMERTMSDTEDAASGVHGVCGGEGGW